MKPLILFTTVLLCSPLYAAQLELDQWVAYLKHMTKRKQPM